MSGNYIVRSYTGGPLKTGLRLPGSKSITNRALLLSAMACGRTALSNFLISDDTEYMTRALQKAGVSIDKDEADGCVVGGGGLPEGPLELYLGNAGTAVRFLTSYFALGNGEFLLDGDARMRLRPIGDLLEALGELGCSIESEFGNGCPPVRIHASGIPGGACTVAGKNSSQYISSLLMAGPLSKKGLKLITSGPVASGPYVDMTLRMMEKFGIIAGRKGFEEFTVGKGTYKSPGKYYIEPDASSASYFLAAAAVLGGEMTIKGLGSDSIQGDSKFALVLEKMGCEIEYLPDSIRLRSSGSLKGVSIDMNDIPDMVPTLAVAALFAEGPTRIYNAANLRIKESDRIGALSAELKKIGALINENEDGLEIFPQKSYNKTLIETYNDHRIAMSFSIAGLKIDGLEIANPACVSKTFPGYFDYFEKIFEIPHKF